jgi:uncharacterized protein (DUF2345 family)
MSSQTQETAMVLASGRTIDVDSATDTITFRAPSGACLLKVTLTDTGPILAFAAATLEVSARDLRLRAERIDMVAGSMAITSEEGLSVTAGGDLALEAKRGGVRIAANDDVDVEGERVRLNCEDPPMPASWEEHQRRTFEAGAKMPRQLDAGGER